MTNNLLLGCGTMTLCLVIQCVVVAFLLRFTHGLQERGKILPGVWHSSALLIAVVMIMFTGILVQITIWATLFMSCGEFQSFCNAFYHSAVNFTTLGYGDVVMSEQRRLLGALEAANGVLMFGLTVSVMFAAVQALTRTTRQKG